MVVADGKGIPLGVSLHPASPAEVTLAEEALREICVGRSRLAGRPRRKLDRLIADKGYDSDALRIRLRRQGVELIVPPRINRRLVLQDGRALRRYRRRWKIERTIAWLGNYRRLVVRWDHHVAIYRAFVQIACALITCRYL